MKPEYSKEYIIQFVRLLSPGGVTIFQIPYNSKIDLKYEEIKTENFTPRMEMYCVKKKDIIKLAPENVKLFEIIEDSDSGSAFDSCKYVFKKDIKE